MSDSEEITRTHQSRSRRDPQFLAILDKAFRILSAYTVSDVWLGSTEISIRADLPKPTASRLAQSLAALGYLHYSSRRRKYRLGLGVLSLGYGARSELTINEIARPYLQRIADEFGVHASLVGYSQTDVMHLDVCHSSNTLMTLRLEPGSRIPLAGTATGHALLAALDEKERAYLMKELERRHSKHWTELRRGIEADIEHVERIGYTRSEGGWHTDINGVACPLRLGPGDPVRAISCGAPARHLPRRKMDVIGRRLLEVARDIAREIQRAEGRTDERETAGHHAGRHSG
ncbi:MAG: IclR family transcriptional regulator [Ectothiorhodospiraceae bacterium]|nr:IclR family transcriptional regulator [Ectothiorhodospiraceae bacterium]